jgi:DNA-binding NarL/FixJ family response regulator
MANNSKQKIRLLVADDHRMILEGIPSMLMLTSHPVVFDITVTETSEEAVRLALSQDFDVILMDFSLPGRNGPKATELILRRKPDARILGISFHEEAAFAEAMMEAGAKGYVLKNIDPDTLVRAIKTVMSGKRFLSNEIALKLIDGREAKAPKEGLDRLTSREREVLGLIIKGFKGKDIAERLGISEKTVAKHREHIRKELGVHNAVELTREGIRLGLVG